MRSPEKKYWPSIWLSYLLFFLTCGSVWADVSGEITGVKLDASQKRVVIESKGTVGKHLARVIGRPNRLVMYFEEMSIGKVPTTIKCGDLNINEIRSSNARGQARVVLDFQENPVPPFHVRKDGNNVFVIFGSPLNADKGIKEFVPDPAANLVAPAAPEMGATPVRTNNQQQSTRKQFEAVASQGGIKPEQFVLSPAAHKEGNIERNGSEKDSPTHGPRSEKANTAEAKKLPILLAQNTEMKNPAASARTAGEKVEAAGLRTNTAVPAQQNEIAGGGGQMVREVRPPVTPPTPDPRLVVQEITELKFIQVGHNSRLIIRGGDHLDYRMTKVSPTKMRLDLINAEIPKVHQKPLKTDLFSTSVEMIVPGSQTIFIQLKDSVPHQVEKKKGVLMIDFPPPRFQMTADQKGVAKPGDTAGREAFQQAGETRREAVRVMKEEEILKGNENRRKALEVLQRQQEDADKQRSDLMKRYRIAPDPAVFSKPVTMDFQGITLRNAFRLLAEQAGINIIVDDKVAGTTTLRLFQVPLGQVIDTIMNTHDLDREMIGNVMRVGKRDDIKKLKDERQKEYGDRMRGVNKRLEEIQKDILKNQADIEKSLKELEKVDAGETTTADDIRTEEVGEAGCIKIKGEDVCFFYATVKLVYATPKDVVRVLQCMFNLNCPGIKILGQSVNVQDQALDYMREGVEAGKEAREAKSQELQQQGFAPDSAGYEQRMSQFDRTQTDQQRTQAAQATAAQIGKQQAPAQVTLPYGTDPDLAQLIANTMLWPDDPNRMIFIKDTQDRIAQMKKVIYTLDVPTPQVSVEARLVQAIRGWSRGIGITWGGRNNQTGLSIPCKKGYWGVEGARRSGTGISFLSRAAQRTLVLQLLLCCPFRKAPHRPTSLP